MLKLFGHAVMLCIIGGVVLVFRSLVGEETFDYFVREAFGLVKALIDKI